MSNPGNLMPMQGTQSPSTTPLPLQLRQQQLAQLLQGGMDLQAPQAPQNTPYAGVANAGNSVLGAMLMKNAQNMSDPQNAVMQQRYGISADEANAMLHPGIMSKVGGLFSMGAK